jgi:hypothetical protein
LDAKNQMGLSSPEKAASEQWRRHSRYQKLSRQADLQVKT